MREAIEAFEQDFAQWDLHLPADAITTKRGGQIRDAGWSIRYNFGDDARGEYLDYYATGHDVVDNPPGDDLHVRIYESGERVALPTVLEAYMYGRDPTWEELERARRKYEDELGGAAAGGVAVAKKAPVPEAPHPPRPRSGQPAHPDAAPLPAHPSADSAADSTADAGVVGLPPLDAPDSYLALDIGLDLDLDIDLDPGADAEEAPPSPVFEPVAEADAEPSAPEFSTPAAPTPDPTPAEVAAVPALPVVLADDLTPRQPVEMVDMVLADDWTITADEAASSDVPGVGTVLDATDSLDGAGDIPAAPSATGALLGFPPDERAAIELEGSAMPPSTLDEVQQGDLTLFIPTSVASIETNPADIPEAHQFVEDATAAIMSPLAPKAEPSSGRPTTQPPAEAVAALAGLGLGGPPPRRDPPAKPAARVKPTSSPPVPPAAASRPADNETVGVDDLDDGGRPVDAEMFKPWWYRSGGRRRAMIVAATASVLLAIGLVVAHMMHWPLPGSASSEAAQAVDSVNAASAGDHPDTAADSETPTESTPAGTTAGADSETGTGANTGTAAATPPAADNPPPAASAPGEDGIVRPAGPNSVPAIVPSRRPGARPR